MNRAIAVVGLPGAGKSEAVNVLEKAGFIKVYFGGLTIEVLKKRRMDVNEKNEKYVRESLRKEHGMAAYAKLSLPKINAALEEGSVVIDGLYSWEEYIELKKTLPETQVIAVYAPPELRYERLSKRKIRPLRRQEAMARDRSQIENINQAGPIAMAGFTIVNILGIDELKKEVKEIINAKG